MRSVAEISASATLSQGIVALSSIIIARLYTPADFGITAVYASLLAILGLGALRYEAAIPLPEERAKAFNLLALSVLVVVAYSCLVGIVCWFFGDMIVLAAGCPQLVYYLWIVPIHLIFGEWYIVLSYWFIRSKDFTRIAKTRLTQSISQTMVQAGLGFFNAGPIGLILGFVTGHVSGSGAYISSVLKTDKALFKAVAFKEMFQVAREYCRMPLLSAPASLLNTVSNNIAPLLLAALYGPQVAGWFALGQKAVAVPMRMISQSIAQVYMGEIARLAREKPQGVRRFFWKVVRRLLIVGGLASLFIGLAGPWLFNITFGEQWSLAGVFIRYMAPVLLTQFIVLPISQNVFITNRQDLQLLADIARLIFIFVVFSFAYYVKLSPEKWIILYSGASSAVDIGLIFVYIYVISQLEVRRESES